MGQKAPKLSSIMIAVVFALSVFGFTLFVWKSFGGSVPLEAKGYRFHVLLGADASNLTSGAEARISGVEVGRVKKVDRRFGSVDAEIEMQKRFAPVSARSRVIVRSKTLLGETFIELTPGSHADPKLADGGTLARSQVREAQGVDQVLGAFDKPTRQSLKVFLHDLAGSLKGRGPDLNAALGNAAPALDDLQRLAVILDRQRPAVQRLVSQGGTALKAIGDRQEAVRSLVTAGDDVLGTTAARDRDLTRTVKAMPDFLTQLKATLAEADATAGDAGPTLKALRPVTPLVRPALDETAGLVRNVVPLGRELGPVIDKAKVGLPKLTDVLDNAKPLLDQLHPAGQELVPTLEVIRDFRREMLASLANVGAASQATSKTTDGREQHYLRILPPILSEAVLGYSQRQKSSRTNAYRAPGGATDFTGSGILKAYDCRNTANAQATPALGGTPPCLVQDPWDFNGIKRSFPHAERAAP